MTKKLRRRSTRHMRDGGDRRNVSALQEATDRNTFAASLPVAVCKMDTPGIEPGASRMLSGCDTTTPCAP